MPKFSVKKPFTVFVGIVMLLILGAVSFFKMTTDLLPSISLPYVVVVTTYPGASPERVESNITEPLEATLGTVNGVKNVTSTSSENYSMVILEFEEETNMDSAMVKLSTAINQITFPDTVGMPMLMEITPDMMATMVTSVDYDGKDIYELSAFVEENVISYLERQDGVASVDSTGIVEKTVEVRLDQKKIDKINDKMLKKVNKKLEDAKNEIEKAENDIKKAKKELEKNKSNLEKEQKNQSDELAKYSKQLDEAVANQAAYNAQVTSLKARKTALETEKAEYEKAYNTVNETLKTIKSSVPEPNNATLPDNIEDAIANDGAKLTALLQIMAMMGQEEATAQLTIENLTKLSYGKNIRIPEIDSALNNLNTEIAAAETVAEQINASVEQAVEKYTEIETGKITAAAAFGAYNAQMASGESSLTEGEKELETAKESYEEAAKTARENANLDALLNMETLSQMIMAENFSMPAGYIYEGENQYLLKVGEEYQSVKELKNTLLVEIEDIGEVRLKDVAYITMIDNAMDSYARMNGNNAIVLSISKSSTAGTSDVSKACNVAIQELEAKYEGLHITPLLDQGDYIKMIVDSVLSNLVSGAVLAIIILIIFLKDVRPTIVVAFSIPLSVLFAIVLMYFSDISLNIISLSGLALGVGMLVDNSIVVIENIYRLRNKGLSSARASVMGANQVQGAIFASTLTTICVFLPIVFTSGLTKDLFSDMGLTIAYSLIASLIVALTVVPSMSATLLRNTKEKSHPLFDIVMDGYEVILRFCLRFKIVPIVLSTGLLALSVWQATQMGMIIIPEMGGNQMTATMTMPMEATTEESYKMADKVMEKFSSIEGVENVGAMNGDAMGISSMSGGSGTDSFTFYIILDEEASKNNQVIAKQMEEYMKELPLEDYSISTSNMDLSALMGSGLQVNIYGDKLETLTQVSEDVISLLSKVEGLENITNGQEEGDTQLNILVDKDEAMKCGLTVAQIFAELSSELTTESTSTTLSINGEEIDVVIVDENNTLTKDNVMNYKFETTKTDEEGNQVTKKYKLKKFAKLEEGKSLVSISRENQSRYISVTAETVDGYNTTLVSRDVETLLAEYEVPDGYIVELAGESVSINDMMGDMILMILMAVAFIYLIMVAQFQSLLSPFIVIFTIPLAFTGGLLALLLLGEELSMVAMMGFLVLAGVVVNNGIVFVDYTNQLRLDGLEKQEALVETGITRMRPILMTALTTILAMSTMALSTDAAAAMGQGMAIVTIGGLVYATLMTLFIVPVLYDLFFRGEVHQVDIGDEDDLMGDF